MSQLTVQQAFDLALQHHRAGRLADAESIYRQILAKRPTHVEALQNLGVIAQQLGRYDIAVDLIGRAAALRPDYAEAQSNLGNALKELSRLDEAIAACRKAIALKPDLPQAYNNLAIALTGKGQFEEAISACRRAIELAPNLPEAHNNMAVALAGNRDFEAAITATRHAIALHPTFAGAYTNLGNILREKIQLDDAVAAYRQSIALRPDSAEAANNLGIALTDLGLLDEAIESHRHALQLKPDYVDAHDNLLMALLYRSGDDGELIAAEHRKWADAFAKPLRGEQKDHPNDRDPDRRLRIGYVSPDFRRHPVGHFLLPIFAIRDSANFEIYCYSNFRHADDYTERFRNQCDHWRSIVELSDAQAAELIRSDRIDILVDLAGHTAANRLRLFARKPAPVQISYLGYPATTGLSEIDYRLTDSLADPVGETEAMHTETLLRLPVSNWCYTEPEVSPPVGPSPVQVSGQVRLGTFNNFAKASPAVIELWAKILAVVPTSCLVIKSRSLDQPSARARVQQMFSSQGIHSDRIEIRGFDPSDVSHLNAYNRIDIALDTYPYHGTTTTCEALWMGVPVVTLAGPTHLSRVGVSLLTTIGLPELIAQSPQHYIEIATLLANDKARLSHLRSTIRDRMKSSPFMDAVRFARNIENAYRQVWHARCSGSKVQRPLT